MVFFRKISSIHLLLASLAFIPLCSFAYEAQSLGEVANQITGSMNAVAKLITSVSYVAGIGFAMMGLFKLKAHKDNPVQVPLSQAFVLLIISAGLVFLPSMISTAGKTMWADGVRASADGSGLEYLHNNSFRG
jgi:intracellular multiplication protein IcmD